jgi:hypothetical protein
MLITIAILVSVLAGYGLGFRMSRKYHRRVFRQQLERKLEESAAAEAELIARGRDAAFDEIYAIAVEAQTKHQA